jgi:hypothetical protein
MMLHDVRRDRWGVPVFPGWQTALKGGFLGAEGGAAGVVLLFDVVFLLSYGQLLFHGTLLESDYAGGASILVSVGILALLIITPICVATGIVNGFILRARAVRGPLQARRAVGMGALVGTIAGSLIVLTWGLSEAWPHTMGAYTYKWDSEDLWYTVKSFAWIIPLAAAVGAWHGWRMGRWLRKRIPGGGGAAAQTALKS